MAENKKAFVAYCDWLESFEELTDEEAGKLAKHLFRYVNDQSPEAPDRMTKMCFIPIKQSLKRDLVKYEERAERARINGLKGGRPKTQRTQLVNSEPKKADRVTVTDTVTVIVNGILLEKETKGLFNEWLDFRKKMRKPIIVESTLISLAKKIKAEGYEISRDVIQHSMDNQYQGLFWKKQKEKESTMELPTEYPKNSWDN
jgi:hypothetical protein